MTRWMSNEIEVHLMPNAMPFADKIRESVAAACPDDVVRVRAIKMESTGFITTGGHEDMSSEEGEAYLDRIRAAIGEAMDGREEG